MARTTAATEQPVPETIVAATALGLVVEPSAMRAARLVESDADHAVLDVEWSTGDWWRVRVERLDG